MRCSLHLLKYLTASPELSPARRPCLEPGEITRQHNGGGAGVRSPRVILGEGLGAALIVPVISEQAGYGGRRLRLSGFLGPFRLDDEIVSTEGSSQFKSRFRSKSQPLILFT